MAAAGSEEDDLYGDIDDTPVFPTKTAAAESARSRSSSQPLSLVDQVGHLEQKVAQLQRENEVLKRNMGTLYRTARAELSRKDKEITRLATELDQTRLAQDKR